jgi:hypothetical protein
MPRSLLARLGPAWILAALFVGAAAAVTAWPLLKPHDPPAQQAAPSGPSGAALFAALTAGHTALFQDDLQAIAQLLRGVDPSVADAVAPVQDRVETLLRREERAAAAAAPPMVLAQFAASMDGAAAALTTGAARPTPPSGPAIAPFVALAAALAALLATPLALLRGQGSGPGVQERQAEITTRLDHGVRAVMEEMAKFRGDVSQARQSFSQASTASERLASVAEIVGERVVQTALEIERTSEQTADLPRRILEQAEMLADVSRRGKETATLLVRLIDDAAARDGEERARLEALAEAVETIRIETDRCVTGIRPLLTSLETIASLPASLEATIDRAATAGVDALLAISETTLVPRLAGAVDEALGEASARCGEAIAATESQARAAIETAVTETVTAAQERLGAVAGETEAGMGSRIEAAARTLDTTIAPLRDAVSEAGTTVAALGALHAAIAAEAEARQAQAETLATTLRDDLRAGLTHELAPLTTALAASARALEPLPAALPALATAASMVAEGAARQEDATARLDAAVAALGTLHAEMPEPALLAAVSERLADDVDALAAVRGGLAALLDHVPPTIARMDTLAAGMEATLRDGAAARHALAAAATRLEASSLVIEAAAQEVASAAAVHVVEEQATTPAEAVAPEGSVTGSILSRLDEEMGEQTRFSAIRSALTEIDVVQDAVSRLAREAETLAEDVASHRLGSLPAPVQQHLPELLAMIDATIGRLHSAATAIAYATDGPAARGAA